MRLLIIHRLFLVVGLAMLLGCETPVTNNSPSQVPDPVISSESNNTNHLDNVKATGEFWARWVGCNESHEVEGTGGNEDEDCQGEDGEDGHEEGEGCQGNRPALDIYVRFDAQIKNGVIKGDVTFMGVGEYEGIEFHGRVTWLEKGEDVGHESNEIFFGGTITEGNIDNRSCFLFALQDNGEGYNTNPDSLQYRLYGNNATCQEPPCHLPKGHPFAVYDGNLQIH